MKTRLKLIIAVMALAICPVAKSQDLAIKSNILSDALLNPNLGIEIGLAPRWSAEVSGELNLWNLSHGRKWKHWVVQPELRYWGCDRFSGHFFGVHLLGGQYNMGGIDLPFSFLGTDFRKVRDTRYQGWFAGAGVAYGYTWIVSRHWSVEAEVGAGWTYTRYDSYPCAVCGTKIESGKSHNYIGITKTALNLIYVF